MATFIAKQTLHLATNYIYIDGSHGEHLAQFSQPRELSVSAQFICQYSLNETIWSITQRSACGQPAIFDLISISILVVK